MSRSQRPYFLFVTSASGVCSCVTKAAGSMAKTGAHLTFREKVSSTRETEGSLTTLIFRNVPEDAQEAEKKDNSNMMLIRVMFFI